MKNFTNKPQAYLIKLNYLTKKNNPESIVLVEFKLPNERTKTKLFVGVKIGFNYYSNFLTVLKCNLNNE